MANRSLPEPSDQYSFNMYVLIDSWNGDEKILFTFKPAPIIQRSKVGLVDHRMKYCLISPAFYINNAFVTKVNLVFVAYALLKKDCLTQNLV